jgi:hypothetical protein
MKFIPILFSTEMVQAILDGRKTQTRRVIKDEKLQTGDYNPEDEDFIILTTLNKYNVSNILWVRETFYAYGKWIKNGFSKSGKQKFKFIDLTLSRGHEYKYLDNPPNKVCAGNFAKNDSIVGWFKRPSLFMPKQACRIFLKITNIRVERLQCISEKDAVLEGVRIIHFAEGKFAVFKNYLLKEEKGTLNPIKSVFSLWESINGKESLNSNPWVWVIEFERIDKPENFLS